MILTSLLPPSLLLSLEDKTWLFLPPAFLSLLLLLSLILLLPLSLSLYSHSLPASLAPLSGRMCESVREEALWRADKVVDGC